MAMTKLANKKVAIVVADGFEQVELTEPKKALEAEGALCDVVAPKAGKVKGWNGTDWGMEITVDVALAEADASAYDALVLPGGVMSSDTLRILPGVRSLVRSFFAAGKPVASSCHGPWTLIDAGVIEGVTMTSWPTLEQDLVNAGARWKDAPVVFDQGLVTSRTPADLIAFDAKMIEVFSGQAGQTAV
ncbi:MAG: type 1 glutamine amidotransferase [Polyangiaceae bacterium]|nr:type 1 glutamine amidotransferase [Polyangiaceae bacterium]